MIDPPPSPSTDFGKDPIDPGVSCPVDPEQLPLEEYRQLERSWFFRWPALGPRALVRFLLLSWLAALPFGLLVASGSWSLKAHAPRLAIAALTVTLVLPLLLLLRQWLGWSHLHHRLCSERVEYEESGWYDGQVWEKPLAWRQRDLLVAQHQVGPVLRRLRQGMFWVLLLMGLGTGLCQAL